MATQNSGRSEHGADSAAQPAPSAVEADASEPQQTDSASDQSAGPQPDVAPTDDVQDVKAKYREALQRKRGDNADQLDHRRPVAGSSIHAEHGKAGGGRTFRRKSGG